MKKMILMILTASVALAGCGKSTTNDNNTGQDETPRASYVQPEMKGEITVSIVEESELLTEAATKFMEKYPDVNIVINDFRTAEWIELEGGAVMSATPDEEFSTENYLNLLNTKIMSGKAEDIMFTDSMSVGKYIEMGVFEDLSFFLDSSEEFNEENYFMKIFDLMKDDNGRLYEIPLGFNPAEIISFDQELINDTNTSLNHTTMNYTEALEFAKKLVDSTDRPNTYLTIGNGQSVFWGLFTERYDEFVDIKNKSVSIDNQAFVDILNEAKALENQGYFDLNDSIDFYNMEYHFALDNDFGLQAAYYGLMPEANRYHSMQLEDANGNINMRTYPRLAINSSSQVKELSWEFIKFYLSDEIQISPSQYSLSVNKSGFDAGTERMWSMFEEGNGNQVSFVDYKGLLLDWYEQINALENEDPVISNDLIYPEVNKFFKGEQSAENTAKNIQTKIDKYFNE